MRFQAVDKVNSLFHFLWYKSIREFDKIKAWNKLERCTMLTKDDKKQSKLEMVNIEDLVDKDHVLRKLDNYIDFSFIYEKVTPLYCLNNGRPSLDPVMLFKMMFLGYIFGIRSERRLVDEIKHNIAYRWFVGLGLTDEVPHHSTFSQNRRRRFSSSSIFQDIFDEIVIQAIDSDLVDGSELFSDSTHIKANANKKKFIKEAINKDTKLYMEELDEAVEADRIKHGKKPLKIKMRRMISKTTRISRTDPDSGYMVREGKPEGFFYLNHRTVDGKHNIITDSYVTSGATHDSTCYLERLDRQVERFELNVEAVALDSGYLTSHICNELAKRDIFAVIAHRRFKSRNGLFPKWKFKYDEINDVYICPDEEKLTYKTTTREGYRQYCSDPEICQYCKRQPECTRSKKAVKVITRHVWEDAKDWVRENRLSDYGRELYKRRSQTIERSFADSKELHGLRYARFRGIAKVMEQCLLTAACQNMKKIALALSRRDKGKGLFYFLPILSKRLCFSG